ncbi:MAG: bifunctional folylpolyglutamate synthase/dihydrofolate synthase [Deltaproteobacteria bacterium]|nr:bifunctional folylpolyglutamate synthase/dihydrofolate synthase [Deltaproteobacteria bacterium]
MPSTDAGILEYLYNLERHGIKPGLGRIERLLNRLGDPHKDYPTVHVAGTNGKGSTSAMLASILKEAGYSAGLYTSPHLIRFNERIRVNNRHITTPEMIKAASTVKKAVKGIKEDFSFFEFTTAMAFLYFRDKKADIAVVETGMGGRWDATNVVVPIASVITNVGLDHTGYLGEKIADIAFEKAGIIKKGVPVITGATGAALKVISKRARELGSPLVRLDMDFSAKEASYSPFSSKIDYSGIEREIKGLGLPLAGRHQQKNAACALAAMEILRRYGLHIPVASVRKGLGKVSWPGRIEVAGRRPLVILDSAHNPDGALTLREAIKGLRFKRLILVLGIMADKDINGILRPLAPLADCIVMTRPATVRAAETTLLTKMAARYRKKTVETRSVKEACRTAIGLAGVMGAVCVTGSIFTVGEARKYL